jgi:hypothetical protein
MIKMLLIDGFFHADPHPGNILVNLETGMVNLLDTGMVGELDLRKRLTLIQLIMAFQSATSPAWGCCWRSERFGAGGREGVPQGVRRRSTVTC